MKKTTRRLLLAALGTVFMMNAAGCGQKTDLPPETPSPLVIQMYGTLDEGYLPFLNALSEKFPEANLQYEYQWDIPGVYEAERRILHVDGPDVAIVNGSALMSLTDQDLLLDLTSTPFSTKYHVSAMAELNDDGRILGLPLPNDLRCLVCNRTILEENGIAQLPETVPELLDICRTLSEKGQGAMIMDDQVYQMLLRTSYLCKPEGYDWLRSYNNGEAAMTGTPAADAWKDFELLAAVSGCSPEDSSSMPAKRTSLMIDGEYAFRCVTMSNLKYMKESNPELDLVALPLLGHTQEDQWVFYAEQRNMRYFVANAALAQPENAAKQDMVLQMLDWISTQEGQQLLASCGSSAISYVNDVTLEQGEIMQYLNPVIETGHLTDSDTLERGVGDAVSACAVQITGGGMTPEEAAAACDMQNQNYTTPEELTGLDEVIGKASAAIYWRKPAAVTVGSPMSQLAANAMAEAFPEADFAFAMAKNTASTLYPGEITRGDVLACAIGEEDSELVLAEATGAQIKSLIDAGIGSPAETSFTLPYGIAGKGRLLHPAGLTYQADVHAEQNSKITSLTLTNGEQLDPDAVYTVIVSSLLVDVVAEPNLKDCRTVPTGKYLSDVLLDYILTHKEISPPEMGFEIVGANPIYTTP